MFKTRDSTPRYYTNTSRDFQLLEHLLDCAISNTRQGVDGISKLSLDKNIDNRLLTLAQTTVGLNLAHNYSSQSLLSICSSFKQILKLKGTKTSIEECVKTLLNAQNLKEEYYVNVEDSYNIEIRIPETLQDLELLEDLMAYILPAGYTYSVIKSKIETATIKTEIVEKDSSSDKDKYTSYELHTYASNDDNMSSYINNIPTINNMSEVGMITIVRAKDIEHRTSTTSELSESEVEEN